MADLHCGTGLDGDFGAFCEEYVVGLPGLKMGECGAVLGGEVELDDVAVNGVDVPAGVRDLVAGGALGAAASEAPVVLGDELFDAAGADGLGEGRGFHGEAAPAFSPVPAVFDREAIRALVAGMPGASGLVGFAVDRVRDGGDSEAWDELLEKDDAAMAGAGAVSVADVEAEVDLFEAPVRRMSVKRKPTRLTKLWPL